MTHKVNALMNFLAAENSDSVEGANILLSEQIMKTACERDGYESTELLKCAIYTVYKEFGMDNAIGVFQTTVLEAFNLQN